VCKAHGFGEKCIQNCRPLRTFYGFCVWDRVNIYIYISVCVRARACVHLMC
jgi:hypothetical protein